MATYTSVQSGDWTTPATWGEAVLFPVAGDRAVIANTHIVEIDTDVTVGDSPANQSTYVITVQAGGTLKWKNVAGDRTLEVRGNVFIARLGRFEIGSSSTPIPDTRIATLYFPTDLGPYNGWVILNQGEFEVCGSRYHMGSSDTYQKTKLTSDITANPGNQVSFDTDDAVDWTTGDTVWFGTGADPLQSPTNCEQVIITKTDADTYTADFANDHHAGDFIIHATRNVILIGDDNTKGVQILCTIPSNDGTYIGDLKINMQWCSTKYFAYSSSYTGAAIYYYPQNSGVVLEDCECHVPVNAVIFKNMIIDEGTNIRSFGITINTEMDFQDTSEFINEVHTWGNTIYFGVCAIEDINIGHLSFIEIDNAISMSANNTYGQLKFDGLWYSGTGTNGYYVMTTATNFKSLENFEIHNYSYGIFLDGATTKSVLEGIEIRNGKIYNGHYYYALYIYSGRRPRVLVEDVEFYTSTNYMVQLARSGSVIFRNCSWDKCSVASPGTIRLESTRDLADIYFYNCTFGTNTPNTNLNVCGGAGVTSNYGMGLGRLVFQNCVIKKPTNADPSQPWTTDVFNWVYSVGATNPGTYYYDRLNYGRYRTIEIINCQVLDGSDVDQWPNRYPGVTRYAYVANGSEIRNEETEILDGTFKAKLLPFSPALACWMNDIEPIRIPVSTGETVTAKLSFKRNANGSNELPGIRLRGCGIDTETYLTGSEALGSWHELEVSGTAVWGGVVDLLISAGTNIRGQALAGGTNAVNTYHMPPTPIPPDWDDMFGVVVYADGLDIKVE